MNMANRRHSGVVGGRHAAFKTVGQIGIADFIKSGDDLLLGDICHFHFVRRGHVGIYVAASSESGFSVECGRLRCGGAARRGILSWERLSRSVHEMPIRRRLDRFRQG
jgi:hypothetical protein